MGVLAPIEIREPHTMFLKRARAVKKERHKMENSRKEIKQQRQHKMHFLSFFYAFYQN